jgi:hypothetical protein
LGNLSVDGRKNYRVWGCRLNSRGSG